MDIPMLIHSKVDFNEIDHTYTAPDGRSLSGVTSLLSRQLFAHKYDGVRQDVMARAAAKGSAIHEEIAFMDTFGAEPVSDEAKTYRMLCASNGLKPLENEYLVSDNDHVASSIDIVFEDLTLADVKTTSRIDEEYLSWQLSIYAYLFEIQNPGLKVSRLLAIWLPSPRYGSPCVKEMKRKDVEEVKRLIAIDKAGGRYADTLPVQKPSADIAVREDVIREICDIERRVREYNARYAELKAGLADIMRENGCRSYKDDRLTLTVRDSYEKESLDAKRLRAEMPEVFSKYVTRTKVKESLTIKVKM